ncbi:Cof-type HAD-IIB family hydrolase [Candidatus Enterovibrio altilux]|uniref:HMP-PP hydrolase Cof n=1 Tax=Candidatus Enterovibrio altilux TaxID=1927128 RepID=A0A291B9J4_9GAMM|nr:Cof-type HAD-IIB family hydrolase [Candidatus Enterovibrio luxaltus]ATF09647.1 HMP-PP hydrolase Cof [Candidatus Enterovibrio luxaltus]
MYKIIASDLDGTLLMPDHKIAPYTRDVLQRLHNDGAYFVFATGRHHIDVANIRTNVGIPAFMITSNGARGHDADDNLVFSHNIEPTVVAKLIKMVKDDETITIHIYRENDWLLNRSDENLIKYYQKFGFRFTYFDPVSPPLEDIAKMFFTRRNHDYLISYEKAIIDKFSGQVSVAFSTPFSLEVMAAGVSKGEALKVVAELQGYSLDDCIAFGDGMNDVEMLSAAKKGLIMETAHARVKAALPNNEVIGSHVDEAVACYLEKYLLKV